MFNHEVRKNSKYSAEDQLKYLNNSIKDENFKTNLVQYSAEIINYINDGLMEFSKFLKSLII
jgi:hypothetical protein